MKLKNFKKVVEDILDKYPKTRNSDIMLTWYIMHLYYLEETLKHEGRYWISYKAMSLVREDRVKRIRALLNSAGKYLPTDPEVLRQRQLKEQEVRKDLGYDPELRCV